MSYCSKSPCQILARYQILLHFAEAGPAIEGKDRQNRMCLTINPKQTSAKIVGTVYDMFTMNCKCKPNRIDIRFVYYLHGSDLSSSKRTWAAGVGCGGGGNRLYREHESKNISAC